MLLNRFKTLLILFAHNRQKSEALNGRPLSNIQRLGKSVIELISSLYTFVSFLGETLVLLGKVATGGMQFRYKEVVIQLERAGIRAAPIVCLVTYLIGIVVAYLFASQSEKFGANIYVVDAVGMGMCRELSPIITAIIVAGRSGSAFTAQIGTMKMTQEIDAISVLGLSPMAVLVLPRLVALIVTLPFLVFLGDIAGVFGGMTIADSSLNISFATFLTRLQANMPIRYIWIGLLKAPVFAFVVGVIGCYRGLHSESNALSVGQNTTSTVVQSIVAVILLNAAFAILFVQLKI